MTTARWSFSNSPDVVRILALLRLRHHLDLTLTSKKHNMHKIFVLFVPPVVSSFLLNVLADLLIIGEFPGLEFRIHERAVDTDFETAAVGRNKHETLDSCLEVFDEFIGQTDRLGFVVSNLAIDNFDFHLFPL